MNNNAQSFRFVTAFCAILALLLPTQASAEVGIAWVEPTRGVSIALDAADNVYTVDYEQALGAEMSLTKRDASGGLLWVTSFNQSSGCLRDRPRFPAIIEPP